MIFPGAIYDSDVLNALHYYARLHLHGHTVGGCNPSLVEVLGTGSPNLANDNPFNRWVAGPDARHFGNEDECAECFDTLLPNDARLKDMGRRSRQRFLEAFTWDRVLREYEDLLMRIVVKKWGAA